MGPSLGLFASEPLTVCSPSPANTRKSVHGGACSREPETSQGQQLSLRQGKEGQDCTPLDVKSSVVSHSLRADPMAGHVPKQRQRHQMSFNLLNLNESSFTFFQMDRHIRMTNATRINTTPEGRMFGTCFNSLSNSPSFL